MERKTKLKIVTTMVVTAAFVFTGTAVEALFYNPEREIEVPELENELIAKDEERLRSPVSLSKPLRLNIPAISVDAHVQHVGISRKGNMAVPSNYTDVGWYRYGSIPGEQGSAVIAGHVDNGFGKAGVFFDLNKLKIGDDIYVSGENGERLHFKVINKQTYHYNEVPTEMVFNDNYSFRLNLITCDGNWLPAEKVYDSRLVVFAELQN